MLKRLIKHGIAIGLGQAVGIVQQLLLPPAFLHVYGIKGYSSWLIMSAGVMHLNSLDFGLQTYIVNRLGMLHHTGRRDEFRRVQSIGLRLVLGVAMLACIALLPILALPLESWLKIDLGAWETRGTIFLLALGILVQIFLGQISGVFRAIGRADRAQHWGNAQRAFVIATWLGLIAVKSRFLWLAAAQLGIGLSILAMVLLDLRRRAPDYFPTMREWDPDEARRMIKPSLFFGLAVVNNFLLFEMPLLILQRTVGPLAVVTFATTRTLFSAGRQLLTPAQSSLIPEFTRLHAVSDQATLARLFRYSDAIALIGGLAINVTLGMGSGVILAFWLRGQVLPAPQFIALMAIVSVVTIYREAMYLFPLATNQHERNTLAMCFSYLGMGAGGWLLSRVLGESGMLIAWLVSEIAITGLLVRENWRLTGRKMTGPPLLHFGALVVVYFLLQSGIDRVAFMDRGSQVFAAAMAGALAFAGGLFTVGRGLIPDLARQFNRLRWQEND